MTNFRTSYADLLSKKSEQIKQWVELTEEQRQSREVGEQLWFKIQNTQNMLLMFELQTAVRNQGSNYNFFTGPPIDSEH